MKKPTIQSMGDFLTGRGFYIVLFLCVAAVGVSGWYLMEESSLSQPRPVVGTAGVEAPTPSASVTPPAITPAVTPTAPAKTAPSTAPTPSASPSPSVQPSAAAWGAQIYTWPVKGTVIGDFSLEVLAYDETMGDWRVHSGLDISAEPGTKVKAVSAGTVSAVYQDDLMGTVVEMEHEGGICSLYANLAARPNVKAGDTLDTGDVLGTVGDTAIAEANKASHLHFELYEDGREVDPMQYLPQ